MKRLILTAFNQNYFVSELVVFISKRESRKTQDFDHCPAGNQLKSIRKGKKPKEEQRWKGVSALPRLTIECY